MKCSKGLEVKAMKSAVGYYIGTEIYDKEIDCEVPNCRISVDYFKTKEAAEQAITSGFVQRVCGENQYCSAGKGCDILALQSIGGMMVKRMIDAYEKGK